MEIKIKENFILNPNQKTVEAIKRAVARNNGHCPCTNKYHGTDDDICPCKAYIEEDHCCCGLYIKR